MIQSHRPENQLERTRCLEALGPLTDLASLHAVVAAIVTATFALARTAYESAVTASAAALVALLGARKARKTAATAFDREFRLWAKTVLDADGKERPTELALVFGGIPSDFLALEPRKKSQGMTLALPQLPARGLTGDATRLTALTAAAKALSTSVAAYDAAVRVRKDATKRLHEAIPVFDRAYTELTDAMVKYDPAFVQKLPVFFRSPDAPPPPVLEPDPPTDECDEPADETASETPDSA